MARAKMTEEQKAVAAKMRKLAKENERREEQEKQAKIEAEWQATKREKWYEIILRVMDINRRTMTEYGEVDSSVVHPDFKWFFSDDNFNVYVEKSLDEYQVTTHNGFTPNFQSFFEHNYETMMDDLRQAEAYLKSSAELFEKERREQEERAAKRKHALSKLTDEEKALLNLR